MRIPAPVILTTVIILLPPIILSSIGADGDRTRSEPWEPDLSLSVDDERKSVDVSPGSTGTVNFTLTISCVVPAEAPSDLSVELELYAWWWDVSDIPEISFAPGSSRRDLVISVTAPVNTSAEMIVDLEVWGTWNYVDTDMNGTIERRDIARIDVIPFYDMFIGSNFPKKYADVGSWAEFPFNITNRSNLNVNITLLIEDDSGHLEVQLDERSFGVGKGETRTLVLRARQNPSRSRGNTIHVYAYIEEDPDNTEWDLPLLFYTEPTFSTFFYERNFLRLVLIILVIVGVSAALFLWERTRKPRTCDEEDEGPERTVVNRRGLNFPGKK
ncbi:MAG: choice-of-anchor T family protein [Thermoplasmatota archaeon]